MPAGLVPSNPAADRLDDRRRRRELSRVTTGIGKCERCSGRKKLRVDSARVEQERCDSTNYDCGGRDPKRSLHDLTRQSSAAASESAAGYLWKYFNHVKGRKQAG